MNYKIQFLLFLFFLISIVIINRFVITLKPTSISNNKLLANSNYNANTTTSVLGDNILCEIQGGVNLPGIYEMKVGDRFIDLIDKAGGLKKEVNEELVVKNLNMTKKLKDQDKFYIPIKINENKLYIVNINNDNLVLIETLPGIGKTTAEKIINNRPYLNIEELVSKKVLSLNNYQNIKELITL